MGRSQAAGTGGKKAKNSGVLAPLAPAGPAAPTVTDDKELVITRDNSSINDDNKAQTMDGAKIQAMKEGGVSGQHSRRRDCHFDDNPFVSLLKHLIKVEGGCSRMTVSPTARPADHRRSGPKLGDF